MTQEKQAGPLMTAARLDLYLDEIFPELNMDGKCFHVEAAGGLSARIRFASQKRHLRPGGSISGPAMFALADVALYVAILAEIGPVPMAVTTNLTINFLRRPEPGDLIGECRLLKLGRRLATGEVSIFRPGAGDVVAHATGSYALPEAR